MVISKGPDDSSSFPAAVTPLDRLPTSSKSLLRWRCGEHYFSFLEHVTIFPLLFYKHCVCLAIDAYFLESIVKIS
jgi:hypothetical protein